MFKYTLRCSTCMLARVFGARCIATANSLFPNIELKWIGHGNGCGYEVCGLRPSTTTHLAAVAQVLSTLTTQVFNVEN